MSAGAAEDLVLNGDFTVNTTATDTPNDWTNYDGDVGKSTWLSSFANKIGVMLLENNGAAIGQSKDPIVPITSDMTFSITFRIDYASLTGDGWYGSESPMNIQMLFTKPGYPDIPLVRRYNYTNDDDSQSNPNFELVPQSAWVTKTYTLSELGVPIGYNFSSICLSSTGWTITTYVDNVQIHSLNKPPVITSFTANPTSGSPPLTVNFTCIATDPDGTIAKYHWDFDGNGTIDSITTTRITSHIYNTLGQYNATVTVEDNLGAKTKSAPLKITVVYAPDLTGKVEEFHFYEPTNKVIVKFKAENIGTIAASDFRVSFYLSNNGSTPILPQGNRMTFTSNFNRGKSQRCRTVSESRTVDNLETECT